MFEHVAVVMPAFNEHEGIASFVAEIDRHLVSHDEVTIVVVDDASPVPLARALEPVAEHLHARLVVVRNLENRGHGPSALRAYRQGLMFDPDALIHVDGDGQFRGEEFPRLLAALEQVDVVYGVRSGRRDPWFRRVLTASLRAWVGDHRQRDVNTPLRAYRPAALLELLDRVPTDSLVPHVRFALVEAESRRALSAVLVTHQDRRGDQAQGTSWGSRERRVLPPRRLLSFCFLAGRELVSASRGRRPIEAPTEAPVIIEG